MAHTPKKDKPKTEKELVSQIKITKLVNKTTFFEDIVQATPTNPTSRRSITLPRGQQEKRYLSSPEDTVAPKVHIGENFKAVDSSKGKRKSDSREIDNNETKIDISDLYDLFKTSMNEIKLNQQEIFKRLDALNNIEASVKALSYKINDADTSLSVRIDELDTKTKGKRG